MFTRSEDRDGLSVADLRVALGEVLRDFDVPEVRQAAVEIAIADVSSPLNKEHISEPATWYEEGERRVLLRVADSTTDRTLDATFDDIEEYKVAVASYLQDFVVDETGKPWPEEVVGGVSRVLDVKLDDLGHAVWVDNDRIVAPVGQLQQRS